MFLPVKSVGVMGDGRTYDYVVALRAVQTSDFMTADWAELPYALLKKVSSRIINEVRGINRVTYDVQQQAAGDDRVGVGVLMALPARSGLPMNRPKPAVRVSPERSRCAGCPSPMPARAHPPG